MNRFECTPMTLARFRPILFVNWSIGKLEVSGTPLEAPDCTQNDGWDGKEFELLLFQPWRYVKSVDYGRLETDEVTNPVCQNEISRS